MADNTDSLPLFVPQPPANHLHDKVIVGDGNRVATATKNIIVNGSDNTISEYCENINLLNCSGVYVYPNVNGATALNSSGIIIQANNEVYINNQLVDTSSNLSNTLNVALVTDTTYTPTITNEIIIVYGTPCTITIPSYTDLGNKYKSWEIKNAAGGDITVETTSVNGFDYTSGSTTPITSIILADADSATVLTAQIDGADTIYII